MQAAHHAGCAAERRLKAFVATSDEIVWELDAAGVITYTSAAVARHLGYQPIELIGQRWEAIMPTTEHRRGRGLIDNAGAAGAGWHDEEYVFTTKSGNLRPLWSNGRAQVDEHGVILGFAGTLRPVYDSGRPGRDEQLRQQMHDIIGWRLIQTMFQPIIDLRSGTTVAVEALSRFPFHTRRTPAQMFADASALGLATELEIAAVDCALTASRALPDDVSISVNVSPSTLLDDGLPQLIAASGCGPGRIILEITEQVPVTEYAPIVTALESLRQHGCRLAVDDAGAGYASFKHILALAPDLIKLDRFLVTAVDTDPARRALIRSVVSFAAEVGADIIAEGIETAAEEATVRDLGVPFGQGYHLGRPLPVQVMPATGTGATRRTERP